MDVGLCEVTYSIKYMLPNASTSVKDIGNVTSYLNCDENIRNTTNVYVRSNFQGKVGVFNNNNVTVKLFTPSTTNIGTY